MHAFAGAVFGVALLAILAASVLADPTQPVNWFNRDGSINWEAERQQRNIPVDTIVIHHTSRRPGMTLKELSELEKQRIYEPFYAKGSPDDPKIAPGSPVHSGHFAIISGKLVESFAIYHFLVRVDGTWEQHMPLSEVGWHAGNWSVNLGSIAICLDDDLEHKRPSEAMLRGVAHLLVHLKCIEKLSIAYMVGHRDVRIAGTTCPGDWFYSGGREEILKYASEIAGEPIDISFKHPDAVH